MDLYKDKPVTLVEFDFTSDESKAKAVADAKKFNLSKVYEANAPKTGFVLVINGDSNEVLGKLTMDNSVDDWKKAVDSALKS